MAKPRARARVQPSDGRGRMATIAALTVLSCAVAVGWWLWARAGADVGQLRGCGPFVRPNETRCAPQRCQRLVVESFASPAEIETLRALALGALSVTGGSDGGASIVDLHRGAVSKGSTFVDLFRAWRHRAAAAAVNAVGTDAEPLPFTRAQLETYANVTERIVAFARARLLPAGSTAALTSPSFFSQMLGARAARTAHDEYWHVHVDREQYGSFCVTALVYLSDAGREFAGGQFVFEPAARDSERVVVDPRRGLLLAFTSGYENPHRVAQVTHGERLALTVALSCEPDAQIASGAFLASALAFVGR